MFLKETKNGCHYKNIQKYSSSFDTRTVWKIWESQRLMIDHSFKKVLMQAKSGCVSGIMVRGSEEEISKLSSNSS